MAKEEKKTETKYISYASSSMISIFKSWFFVEELLKPAFEKEFTADSNKNWTPYFLDSDNLHISIAKVNAEVIGKTKAFDFS